MRKSIKNRARDIGKVTTVAAGLTFLPLGCSYNNFQNNAYQNPEKTATSIEDTVSSVSDYNRPSNLTKSEKGKILRSIERFYTSLGGKGFDSTKLSYDSVLANQTGEKIAYLSYSGSNPPGCSSGSKWVYDYFVNKKGDVSAILEVEK